MQDPPAAHLEPSRLFYSADEFPALREIQLSWRDLHDEWLTLWAHNRDLFLKFEGHADWMAYGMVLWGYEFAENLQMAPCAAALWIRMRDADLPRITTWAFSVLMPGCHIKPHHEHVGTSGVRTHLGLQVPDRCALRAMQWREGQWTIFNGKRNHEAASGGAPH